MKICIDTSILVELDRKNEKLIHFLKTIIKDHDIFLSVISILEILTGSNLRKDRMKAVNKAKSIMGQFIWVDIDSEIAEKSAEINAFLITQGEKIEIQ
ncbi:MAG: type II toxin-antitoxin system VapC family toxin, partial [Candidatus Helarchaeota archaeon]